MPTTYLISRAIDPIFAISVGIVAAGVRINREEKEKHPGRTMGESFEALKRRVGMVWEKEEKVAKTG